MDEDNEERLKDIVNNLNRDIEMPPYDSKSSGSGYSRQYQEYKEEEELEREKTQYEKMCLWFGSLFNLKAGKSSQNKLSPPLRLLGWDITPGMVLSASIGAGFFAFFAWMMLFMIDLALGFPIPLSIILIIGIIPFGIGIYTYYKPVYAAKNKVIESSGEMILAVLYMVIYLRTSPNMEGAVRFAALNLEGPIAKDLKGILWDVEVGKFNTLNESMEMYTKRWKDYNDDFLESLQLLNAAVNEPNEDRRKDLLQDSIDRILDGTREKMKHYAQNLKTPVMILNAMGAMLPVLGMIMLPLISVFMGGVITSVHLFMLFNILLPLFLYWFMQQVLQSRPPTVSSEASSEGELPKRGRYTVNVFGNSFSIPTWPIGLIIFLVIGAYGITGYLSFPHVYPISQSVAEQLVSVPSIYTKGEGSFNSFTMLMRSVSITLGLGIGIGVSKYLGNVERRDAEEDIKKIEEQFPTALFQLGNKISGGTPIELALEEAAEATSELEISNLFAASSKNIEQMGMTFEDAIFDPTYGALKQFPSQLIHTVMKAVLESSEKGTHMASMAMVTISRYLDNIHETQEQLNDLMEETTTTIQMLAYLLAPVISGVAVGMSQTIITAMFELSRNFRQAQGSIPGETAGGSTGSFTGIFGNIQTAIAPEVLNMVVGIYLVQLLWILSTFFTKIKHGEDMTYRNIFVGKTLIIGIVFYTLTLIIIGLLFGGVVSSVAGDF